MAFPPLVTTTGRVVVDPVARSPKASEVVLTSAVGAGTTMVEVATSPPTNRRVSTLRRVSMPSVPSPVWVTVMTFSPPTVANVMV